MRKLNMLLLFTVLNLFLVTAYASNLSNTSKLSSNITKRVKSQSSSMIRTMGVGENAMPIEEGSFTVEFFADQAISVDKINETTVIYTGEPEADEELPEDEYSLTACDTNKDLGNFGFNARYGLNNYTEFKIGIFGGSVKNGSQKSIPYGIFKKAYFTNFSGYQFGLKQLLTDYNSPHRISLFAEAKLFTTSSKDAVAKYDGEIFEFKSALIYGYLENPGKRNFPSFSLYYSHANTKRDETIAPLPLKTQPKAIGLEANYNLDSGRFYCLFSLGAEKELGENNADSINTFWGLKLGVNFNRKSRLN